MVTTFGLIIHGVPNHAPTSPALNTGKDADQEYVRIKIKPFYRDTILDDPFLMDGNLEIYKIKGHDYMISVGAAEIDGPVPAARLN
jgi:hypothetical protein